MASDDVIPAAPCPKCKSPMAIAAADFGFLVECPNCHSQFRARPDPAKVPEPEPPPNPAEERRREARERRAQLRRRARPDYDDRDDIAESRRRNRDRDFDDDRDSDEDRDTPRQRPGESARKAAAYVTFVFASLLFMQSSCLGLLGEKLLDGTAPGGPGAPFGSNETTGLVLVLFSVWYLAGFGLMVPAGISLLNGRKRGTTLGYLSAAAGMLHGLSIVFLMIMTFRGDRNTAATTSVIFLFPALLWLGYSITTLILLSKVRPLPTRGIENGFRG